MQIKPENGAKRDLPPCFMQGDFVVDHAHGMVDLEASQCGSLCRFNP
jgi:hypothetical protein